MLITILIVVAVFIILIGALIARKVHKKRTKRPPDDMYPMW